jgi:hypothetical protein
VFLLPLVLLNDVPAWLRITCLVGLALSMLVDIVVWIRGGRGQKRERPAARDGGLYVLWIPVVIIVVLSAAVGYLSLRGEDCSFDRERWAAAKHRHDANFNAIEGELEKLVGCSTLEGKTRAEVRSLIGPQDGSPRQTRLWYYNVGIPDGLSDYPGLHVTFNGRGRVVSARVPGYTEP